MKKIKKRAGLKLSRREQALIRTKNNMKTLSLKHWEKVLLGIKKSN